MAPSRLSKEDWIAAGFRALAANGPTALRAEALARGLETTKGSFYWHFKDMRAFRTAMLDLWEAQATDAVIASLSDVPAGADRLRQLAQAVSATPAAYGGAAVEPAIRDWAQSDADAAERLARIDAQRIAFIEQDVVTLGFIQPNSVARLVYAAHLGLEQLARQGDGPGEKERILLIEMLAALKTHP